jgi:Cortical protein marker for cell polarity
MEWATISRFKYEPIGTRLIIAAGLGSTSRITDMEFLPLSSNHANNNILSSDRVILLMGDIQLAGFGSASAVLYDGSSFQPYILSTKSDGSNGVIYTLFSQHEQTFSSQGKSPRYPAYIGHIPLGWIIVIALAVSLFLVLLIVIGGLIAARIRRAREGYLPAPSTPPIRETSLERVPPDQLLGDMEERRRGYPML